MASLSDIGGPKTGFHTPRPWSKTPSCTGVRGVPVAAPVGYTGLQPSAEAAGHHNVERMSRFEGEDASSPLSGSVRSESLKL